MCLAWLPIAFGTPTVAADQSKELLRGANVYRLACPNDPDAFKLPSGDMDRQALHKILDHKAAQLIVRNLLLWRSGETGIERDRIPVRGSEGRKLGTGGMVLLAGGEYVRSGHYYTSQSAELGERTGEKYRVRVSSFWIDKYKVTLSPKGVAGLPSSAVIQPAETEQPRR